MSATKVRLTQPDIPSAVPSGYRRSDVGVIPSDWSVFSIGELFDYQRTASNSRADLGNTGIVAYVHYGDIHTRFHHFIDFSLDDVPRLLAGKSVTTTRLRDGDLIVADASEDEAGVGKSVEIRNLGAIEAVSGLHTFLLRSKDRRVQDGYRGYLLEKAPVKAQLRRLATGLKVFGISKRVLRDVRIPLPPPVEQRAIAEALSDVDGLLGVLEKVIVKKRAIKQGTMQQLLTGKTRLPGFREKYSSKEQSAVLSGDERTKVGKISEDWDMVRVDTYASIKTGEKNTQDKKEDGEYPFFVRSQEIERINTYSYDGEAVLTAGDGVGTGKVFHYIKGRFDVHQRVYRITDFSDRLNGQYFFYQFSSRFYHRIMSMTAKSSVDSVRMEMIAGMQIPLPHPSEQRAIATVLSDMDDEIAALKRRQDKTQSIKQGMMQQLLTGRVRLVKPEVIA